MESSPAASRGREGGIGGGMAGMGGSGGSGSGAAGYGFQAGPRAGGDGAIRDQKKREVNGLQDQAGASRTSGHRQPRRSIGRRALSAAVKPDEDAKAIVWEQFSDEFFKVARNSRRAEPVLHL